MWECVGGAEGKESVVGGMMSLMLAETDGDLLSLREPVRDLPDQVRGLPDQVRKPPDWGAAGPGPGAPL